MPDAGYVMESGAHRRAACGSVSSVALGHFDPLQEIALRTVLSQDRNLCILGGGLLDAGTACTTGAPGQVALIDERASPRSSLPVHSEGGVVILAHEPSSPLGMVLLAAGVSCVAWSASPREVLHVVHLTARGGCAFVSGPDRVERRDRRHAQILTKREVEVLELLSRGDTNGEIALTLKISIGTVKKHVESVLEKVNASSRRELIEVPIEWFDRAA